jgi:hypothetical protein
MLIPDANDRFKNFLAVTPIKTSISRQRSRQVQINTDDWYSSAPRKNCATHTKLMQNTKCKELFDPICKLGTMKTFLRIICYKNQYLL